MKLNPFGKKTTTGYYERIKAEFAETKQQLEEAQSAADEAKADAEAKLKARAKVQAQLDAAEAEWLAALEAIEG